MAGVILSIRPLVRMGLKEWLRSESIIDGGHAVPTREEIEAQHEAELDAQASQIGVFLAIVGTVVWTYLGSAGSTHHYCVT
jgi:hypothetical protein